MSKVGKSFLGLGLILALMMGGLPFVEAQVHLNVTPASGTVGRTIIVDQGATPLAANAVLGRIVFAGTPITVAEHGLTIVDGIGSLVGDEIKTDGSGNFKVQFIVPRKSYGAKTIAIPGVRDTTFTVTPRIVKVTPFSLQYGDTFQVEGTGFSAGKKVSIYFDGNKQGEVTADGDGYFNASVTVADAPYGLNTITATDENGHSADPIVDAVFINPKFTQATFGNKHVDDNVEVEGHGFVPGPVTIEIGGQTAGTGTADAKGYFKFQVPVPHLYAGTKSLKAISDSASATQSNAVTVKPKIWITPTAGKFNDSVTVTGTGFGFEKDQPGEQVRIDFGTTSGITTVRAKDSPPGDIEATFKALSQTTGLINVTATGLLSGETYTVQFLYSSSAQPRAIILSKNSASVGTQITAKGYNYPPNTSVGNLLFDTAVLTGLSPGGYGSVAGDVITTDAAGLFEVTFAVPLKPARPSGYIIDTSLVNADTKPTFQIVPGNLTHSTDTAYVAGTQSENDITVSANGFYAGETVRVAFGSNSNIKEVDANSNGEVTATFKSDHQPSGKKGITLTGVTSGLSTSKSEAVEIKPDFAKGGAAVEPNEVAIGGTITVKAYGLPANTGVEIDFGATQKITTATTAANGDLIVTFQADNQPSNDALVVKVRYGSTTLTAPETVKIKGVVDYVTPGSGKVGDLITVVGEDVPKGKYSVYLGGTKLTLESGPNLNTDKNQFELTADHSNYTVTFKVPTKPGGTYDLQVRDGSVSSTVPFTIQAQLTKPGSNIAKKVGESFDVAGNGFAAGQSITITLGGRTIKTVTAGSDGTFSTSITVPEMPYTAGYSYEVKGNDVEAPGKVKLDAKIALDPTSGPKGTSIKVVGKGFGAEERVNILMGGNFVTSASTDANGTFGVASEVRFNATDQPHGTVAVSANGERSGAPAQANFTIRSRIQITEVAGAPGSSGHVGDLVTLVGSGFTPGEAVTVTFNGSTVGFRGVGEVAPVVQRDGSFNAKFLALETTSGPKTVTARGTVSGETVSEIFGMIGQITSVTPAAGTVGTLITVTGNGYGKEESLQVTFDNTVVGLESGGKTNASGSFTLTFKVPTRPAGKYTVGVKGVSSNEDHAKSDAVEITPRLTEMQVRGDKNQRNARVGDTIRILGDGWPAGEALALKFGGSSVAAGSGGVVNGDGTVDVTLATPLKPAGTYDIEVKANSFTLTTSGQGLGTVNIIGRIKSVSPTSGTEGTPITVQGDGFGAFEDVTITFGGNVAATTTTSSAGEWTANFDADVQPAGPVEIVATGISSGQSATNKSFVYSPVGTPTLVLRKPGDLTTVLTSGTVGTEVLVVGSGYTPNSSVGSLTFDGTPLSVVSGSLVTDAAGTFQVTVAIPQAVQGAHTIDTTNPAATNKATFTVEPKLTLNPASGVIGTQVIATGTGYKDEIGQLTFEGQSRPLTDVGAGSLDADGNNITADSVGRFEMSFTVPGGKPRGGYTVAVGAASTTFVVEPRITSVSPTSVQADNTDSITITGDGFTANGQVKVKLGGTEVTTTANADGTLTYVLGVGYQVGPSQTLEVTDLAGPGDDDDITRTRTITILRKITITPLNGTVGSKPRVSVYGFGKEEKVRFDMGSKTDLLGDNTPTTDATGKVVGQEITVPEIPGGLRVVRATGLSTGLSAVTSFTVLGSIEVIGSITDPTPDEARIGDTLTVKGKGFAYPETVNLFIDPAGTANPNTPLTLQPGTGSTNSNGTFEAKVTLPTMPGGPKAIKASGAVTTVVKDNAFKLIPDITYVFPKSVQLGTTLTLQVNGFAANSPLNVELGGTDSWGTGTQIAWGVGANPPQPWTADNGTQTISFEVPALADGTNKVKVQDATGLLAVSQSSKDEDILFSSPSTASAILVSPNSGSVGTEVTITGLNFDPSVDVGNLILESAEDRDTSGPTPIYPSPYVLQITQVLVGSLAGNRITTDANGAFIVKANIPQASAGPDAAGGLKYIDVKPSTSNAQVASAPGQFTITQKITITPTSGPTGTTIKISGTGYGRSAVLPGKVTIEGIARDASDAGLGEVQDAKPKSDGNGRFEVTITVPADTPAAAWGEHVVQADMATAKFKTEGATISVSPSQGPVGTLVTVTGKMFKAGETVTIDFGSTENIASGVADANGNVTITFNVDTQSYGDKVVKAKTAATDAGGSGQSPQTTFKVTGLVLSVLPTSGVKGTEVTATGTGFQAGESIRIDFGSRTNVVPGVTARSNGSFSATFNTPPQPYGNRSIVATGTSSGQTGSVTFKVEPSLAAPSPAEGTVGTTVTIRGWGFGANEPITVSFGGTSTIATLSTDGEGTFSGTFVVDQQPYGAKTIKVKGSTTGQEKTATFTIKPRVISVSPASLVAGEKTTISGDGFTSGAVDIYLVDKDDTTILATLAAGVDADDKGTFSTEVTIPTSATPGERKIRVVDTSNSAIKATKRIDIVVGGTLEIVSVSPGDAANKEGYVGSLVTVRGTEYGTETVEIRFGPGSFDDAPVVAYAYASGGQFQGAFQIQPQPGGSKTIWAEGQTTKQRKQVGFTVKPRITSVSPKEVRPGEFLSIVGNGLGADEEITVLFGGEDTDKDPLQTISFTTAPMTNALGQFSFSFPVPIRAWSGAEVPAYVKLVTASSSVEVKGAIDATTVKTIGTSVVLAPEFGVIGSTVTVSGVITDASGNALRNTDVGNITFGGDVVTQASHGLAVLKGQLGPGDTIVTDGNGAYQVTFSIPSNKAGGVYSVSLFGAGANYEIVGNLVAPAQTTVPNTVVLSGDGYLPNETVTISIDGVAVKTVNADQNGRFANVALELGLQPGGPKVVKAEGALSRENRFDGKQITTIKRTITVVPQILSVDPAEVNVGDTVHVTGNGLGAEEAILVDFGVATDIVPASGGTSAADGTFDLSFVVPSVSAGANDVTVKGSTSGLTATLTEAVTVKSGITASPEKVAAGTQVTVTGAGFPANQPVIINFGTQANVVPDVTTSAVGGFEATFAAPAQAAGPVTISATAGTMTATTQVTYEISITQLTVSPTDPVTVGAEITVTAVSNLQGGTATFSIEGTGAQNVAMTEDPAGTYKATYTVAEGDNAIGKVVTVALSDGVNQVSAESSDTVHVDTQLLLGDPVVKPDVLRSGTSFTITVDSEGKATVTVDISQLDPAQTEPIALDEAEGAQPGMAATFSKTIALGEVADGTWDIIVSATDLAGNTDTRTVSVKVQNATSFTIALHGGLNFIHVPVDDPDIETVADVYAALGSGVLLVVYYDTETGTFQSYSEPFNKPTDPVNITLQPYTGLIAVMKPGTSKKVTFEGPAYQETNVPLVKGKNGLNLVGLPVNDPRVTKFSELAALSTNIVTITGQDETGSLKAYPGVDLAITGGQSFILVVSDSVTLELSGEPWENNADALATPPVAALAQDATRTGVFAVEGFVALDETQALLDGMKVTVRNVSTNATLQNVTGSTAGEGKFSVTFVDTTGRAVAIGDVLEVQAADPSGRFGSEPLRHVVTRDDILSGRLMLDVRMLEIPKETALLANYPNPFNPETWIPFHLAEGTEVRLSIFDATGRLVRTLDLGYKPAGKYESRAKAAYWDGRNAQGERVASGVYFYRMEAGHFSAMRKMLVVK